jgi:AcrR family transcriptional regulator
MERRKQAIVEDIVDATIELFRRDGFDETTIDAIVAAAGCSRTTFYRHFASKEDVLFYDFAQINERFREGIDANLAAGMDPWAAVSKAMLEGDILEHRRDHRVDLWLREPSLRAHYMRRVADGEDVIIDCLTRHRGTKPEQDELAQLIATAAISAYRTSLVTHPPGNHQKFTRHLRGLLTRLDRAFAPDDTGDAFPGRTRNRKPATAGLRTVP